MTHSELDYTNHEGKRAIRRVVVRGAYFGTYLPYHPRPEWLLVVWDLDRQAERVYAQSGIHSWDGVPVPQPSTSPDQGKLWAIWWHGSQDRGDHLMELATTTGTTYSREIAFLGPDHHKAVENIVAEHNDQVRWLQACIRLAQDQVAVLRERLDWSCQVEDCCWPFCSCDPTAVKVVEKIQEAGRLKAADMRGAEL